MDLEVGAQAPQFTLTDADGNRWSLADQRGKPVVLYFYPRDDTPGCTTQACDIRDSWSAFEEAGAVVVGISPDDEGRHRKFRAKYDLPHTLLADPDHVAIEAYGAWGEKSLYGKTYQGVIRSSVVIGPDGTLAGVFPTIKPKEQVEKSLAVISAL